MSSEPVTRFEPAMTVEEVLALVNRPALEEMAIADDNFYNGRFRSNQAFSWYNKLLLTEIDKLPAARSYHEIGGGAGILPIGLALRGHDAVSIDHFERRVTCGRRIVERLAETVPSLPSRIRLVLGSFPAAVEGIETRDAYAITTNFAGTLTTEPMEEEEIVGFLEQVRARYGGYVFDTCLLGGCHREPETWGRILDLVRSVFGREPRLMFDKRIDYARYYFVEA